MAEKPEKAQKKPFLQKAIEKFIGKVVDAQLIEPLGDVIVNLLSLLDVDSQPEIKFKVFYAKAKDHETQKKERWLCFAVRRIEPES